MTQQFTRLDMGMMFGVHNALRRDLVQIGRLTARLDDDPARLLGSALGWSLFKQFLHIHHTSEDVTVWPVLRDEAAGNADGVALAEAMEAEHARIDPLLAAVDAAVADRDYGHQRLGDLVDTLTTELSAHLKHEEDEGLALIDATLSPEAWQKFAVDHRDRVGQDARRYLPWLLDGASEESIAQILGKMPPPLIQAFRTEWGPAYAELDLWSAAGVPTAAN